MTALVDTSVLIDFLRGHDGAAEVLQRERAEPPLHASEMTRVEVLTGRRPGDDSATLELLSTLTWHAFDAEVAEHAGELGRTWRPSHHSIDGADRAIAATAIRIDARLLARKVKHFPMFPGVKAPY